jgi:hypothetical protein
LNRSGRKLRVQIAKSQAWKQFPSGSIPLSAWLLARLKVESDRMAEKGDPGGREGVLKRALDRIELQWAQDAQGRHP